IVSAMNDAGITSFTMGTGNAYFGSQATDMTRTAKRASVGINGSFVAFDQSWNWDVRAQTARTSTHEMLPGTHNVDHYTNAVDVVLGPDGVTPQCASAAARAE